MIPKLLLRIAAVLMLLHAIGHTIGFSQWKHDPIPEKQKIIDQMIGQKFPFMGANRSIADFHDGFGYTTTMFLLLMVCMLWIASSVKEENSGIAIKILIPVTFFLFLLAVDEMMFFFLFAVSFSLLSAILSLVAVVLLYYRKKSQQDMSM
jgi:hypothetical protein